MTLCKLVREQTHAEALSCLSPIETSRGFLVLSLISFRGFELPMKFMREREDLYLYFNNNRYELYKGRGIEPVWDGICPPDIHQLVEFCNRETQESLIHSTFCRMMRLNRKVGAACEAHAAHAAHSAICVAHRAACAAYYKAAYMATCAAYRAACDMTYAVDNKEFRKAFRLMIKWRKIK